MRAGLHEQILYYPVKKKIYLFLFIPTEEDEPSRSTCPWSQKFNNTYFCIVTRIYHVYLNLELFCLAVKSVWLCLFTFCSYLSC